ncbi:MAG: RNA polymerase sigma factor [Succinivibrionaceae bacterium]
MITQVQMQKYYDDIAPRLVNYLIANGCSYEQASDFVQETFIKLWKKRDVYSPEDNITSLVFQIAKNLRIDYIRHAKFEVITDDFSKNSQETQELEDSIEENDNYLKTCLQKALAELPNELRECYVLFNISEMSIKDIVKQLGISESLVKVRIHRAKVKLAESLSYLKNEYL